MSPHVVFLGPDLFDIYRQFARGLKQAGATVTGIGHTPVQHLDSELRLWLDGYQQVGSLLDAGQVLEAARRIERRRSIDRLETADEALVLAAAKVREQLGLPGLSVRTVTLCRDKPAMKAALRQAGVPCAASLGSASRDDLRAFAEREGFPLVVKPRAALGGLGTRRVETMAELEQALDALGLRAHPSHEGVAVEEFIEGHEGFYDTLSLRGEVVHEFAAHYYPTVLTALQDRGIAPQIAVTNRLDEPSYDELKAMGRRVISVLGIDTAATHMEWFFGPKGLKFSEIGARPPGERIWDLYCTANDMDMYLEWALLLLHGRSGCRPSRRFATGSVQVRPSRDGRISGYDGLRRVLDHCRPWITRFHAPPAGSATVPLSKGYLCNTWFRLHHPDYDQLRDLMTFIGHNLHVRAVAA